MYTHLTVFLNVVSTEDVLEVSSGNKFDKELIEGDQDTNKNCDSGLLGNGK